MSKLLPVLLILVSAIQLTMSIEGGFHIEGTKLIDAKGNEFIMRGINHAYTWFKDVTNPAMNAIANTKANTKHINPIFQLIISKIPSPVATPFPPLNPI